MTAVSDRCERLRWSSSMHQHNMRHTRDLTDEQWKILDPLVPGETTNKPGSDL